MHLCRVRTQNHDPDTVGRGLQGKGRKGGRGPTKYIEKRNGRAGVVKGAVEAAVGEENQ